MNGLADTAAATAAAYSMFEPGATVVAMVSGGADSVALLRALAGGVFGPVALSALHVDHRLRGAESDRDAAFVRELCGRLGVPCTVASVDVAAFAGGHRLNLEDAGRRVRYAEAEDELHARCAESGADTGSARVATAHTLDDRAETALMRLAQGTGAGGLVSLAYRRGNIVRPLLDCTRAVVLAYLDSLGQPWRQDASNLDTSRVRARVRAELMPLLRGINPRFDEAMARTLAVIGDEDAFLDGLARNSALDIGQTAGGVVSIDRAGFVGLPRVLQRRVLRLLIRAAFEDASRLEYDHVEAVCEGSSDADFARDLPDGLRAFAEYGRLIISRSGVPAPPFTGGVLPVPGVLDLGEAGVVTAAPGGSGEPEADPRVAILDAGEVSGPLTVTPVRPGDRMRPFGMSGSRKLSDILVDAKVPARLRPLVPVVRDGERIVWVAGLKSSEDYRVGPGTTRTVRLTWQKRSSEGTSQVIHPDIESVIVAEDRLRERIAEMGAEISRDYEGKTVLLVAVLRGAALFLADLSREITVPVEIDFMAVSSYGSTTKSSGVVRILKDLDEQIEGRDVLVVEDILDTGLTLKYLLKNLASRKPASLEVATLLSKEGKQRVPISCKYVGFNVPDEFVVGFGLDFAERYRNLPYIGVLRPSAYQD